MSANFNIAYSITRQNEGGWHGGTGANSADRGGETFKGIARKIWGSWQGWAVIDRLRSQQGFPNNALNNPQLNQMVKDFYMREFWNRLRLGEFNSQAVANEMFDTAVNVGVGTAANWLQRSLNLLNRNQRSWPDMQVTGVVGPITLQRVNSLSTLDTNALFNLLNIFQGQHYINISERDRTQEEFMRGWLTRVELMR